MVSKGPRLEIRLPLRELSFLTSSQIDPRRLAKRKTAIKKDCVTIFSTPGIHENVARLPGWSSNADRNYDAPVSMERGGHCGGWRLRPACAGSYQSCRCALHPAPGVECLFLLSWHDGSFRPGRNSGLIRLV